MENQYIGIMMDDSPALVTGLLGILKSGNHFVPINPKFPPDRIHFIIKDCGITVLLTDKSNHEKARQIVESYSAIEHLICMDKENPQDVEFFSFNCRRHPTVNNHASTSEGNGSGTFPHQPGYVIYTSGSTGRPKGVPISNDNLTPLLLWGRDYFKLNENIKVMQNLSYTFDFGVFEIFTTVLFGGRLYMLNKEKINNFTLYVDFINQRGINTIHTTPSFCSNIAGLGQRMPSLETLHLGGERLTTELVRKVSKLVADHCKIYNGYGPTEATINSLIFSITAGEVEKMKWRVDLPIGKPSANNIICILDKYHCLQPLEVAGALCVAGVGLASGYLNNPELTAEKFVRASTGHRSWVIGSFDKLFEAGNSADNQCPMINHRLYKTGDLARWLWDGNVEFLGRLDNQVKIRGFRIELGEIKNHLLKHEHIEDAVVLVKERKDGDRYLCAYIVSDIELTTADIRGGLSRDLPDYMLPSYFMRIDTIPLTPNGKIDRKTLPGPEMVPAQEYVAPRGEVEKKLAEIWWEVLGIGKEIIGIDINFFEIGGHSLKALHLLNAIQKEFKVKIDFQDIFQYPTIAGLSRLIRKSDPAVGHEIRPQPEKEYYDLSYSQWRLMVLYQLDPDSPAFNLPTRITLYEPVDETIIRKVLEKLVKRHDSFRTYFKSLQGEPVQIILPRLQVNLEVRDLSHLSDTELEKNRQQLFRQDRLQPFKLDIPPLFRVKLIKCREEEFDLILIMHHIITDGWSMEVLGHEFMLLYEAYKKGEGYDPGPLKVRYFDYVYWHHRLLEDKEKMQGAKEFWKSQLKGNCPILELPYDYSKKNLAAKKSAAYRTVVPEKTARELRKLANARGASLFMVLLAGYNIMLSRITSQQDIMLAVPGAARRHEDLKNIVGMFVNTLIVRNKPNPGETFISFLENLQTNTLQVLEHQSYPLELLCSEFNITYPDIPVFFNMSTLGSTTRKNLKDLASYHIEQVQQAKFDIVSYVAEYKNGIEIDTHYFKELFKPLTIEKTMKMYLLALENIVKDPGKKIGAYNLMARERKLKFSN